MSKEKPIKLAESLNHLMREKNLTFTKISRLLGMNKSTLHNYCNGVMPRNLVQLQALAELLGVTLNELVSGGPDITIENQSLSLDQEVEFRVRIKRVRG